MGVCFAGIHNESPFAMAYSHATQIAREGCVGITMCNSRARVAPINSYEPVFGPNPIAISFPITDGEPLTIDFATSAISMAEIRETKNKGELLPKGIAVDKNGNPTCSPEDALEGAVLPFGGHKGYALAMAIELLAGPLVGAKAGKTVPGTRGFLIGAWSFQDDSERNDFEQKVGQFIDEISNSKSLSGKKPRVPGMNSILMKASALKSGIEIDDDLYNTLRAISS